MTGCEHHKGGEGENNSQLMMPREKMLKFGISALRMSSCWRYFCVPERAVKMYYPGKRDAGEFRLSLWLVNL